MLSIIFLSHVKGMDLEDDTSTNLEQNKSLKLL